jgi:hypothetical protein
MKKRILSLAMIAWMLWMSTISLCFAGEVAVPATLRIAYEVDGASFYISERVTLTRLAAGETGVEISPIEIKNWSKDKVLKLEKVKVEPKNGWALMEKTTFDAAEKEAQKLYLYIPESTGDHVFTYDADDDTVGAYTPTDFLIPVKGTRSVVLEGEAGVYTGDEGKLSDDGEKTEREVGRAILTLSATDVTVDGITTSALKKVQWSSGSNKQIVAVIKAIDAGYIDADDLTGWDVGAERSITLTKMEAAYDFTDTDGTNYTGSMESHAEQTATLVIMDTPGSDACKTKTWKDGTTDKAASFIVGLKNSLKEGGYQMDSGVTYPGTWVTTGRRAWCNSTFYQAMLSAFDVTESDNFFKKVTNVTGTYSADDTTNGGTNSTTYDYFALPAACEVFASSSICTANESASVARFSWYAAGNTGKTFGDDGTSYQYNTRSPSRSKLGSWSIAGSGGKASDGYGISPFGCI